MLLGTNWRPGSITGTDQAQFGLVPMIAGSVLATFGAIVPGVPLSVGTAILPAEVAPQAVREVIRPAVELLAGIPSAVYGLFGMVVLAPPIRTIEVPYNTGFGLLNASIILAVMLIPTVTNIAKDAICAVPHEYKESSLALGATHWQTIVQVILPAARSGIVIVTHNMQQAARASDYTIFFNMAEDRAGYLVEYGPTSALSLHRQLLPQPDGGGAGQLLSGR
jgi:phosphate transport system permease protein